MQLPTSYFIRNFVEAGGLMSYGPDAVDNQAQLGIYVGRILKGEKPADLPIVQPMKYDLVVNLKAASALGIEIPVQLLARADKVRRRAGRPLAPLRYPRASIHERARQNRFERLAQKREPASP